MEKEIKNMEKKIGNYVLSVVLLVMAGILYNTLLGLHNKLQDWFISCCITLIIGLVVFVGCMMIGFWFYEKIVAMAIKKRFPTLNTYETLNESVFLETSLLMKRFDEKTDLKVLVEKIKKRNFDFENIFVTSLHHQSEIECTCSICNETIELKKGKITSPCECKSIQNYKNS